jgi:Zn-dependent peptidase ImmA (M78 family)
MEIDDVGANPTKLADAVLDQLGDITLPIPVRDIARAVGIVDIREEPLTGLEGCLVTTPEKFDGEILVNNDRPESRIRFTIGHELGHFLNPLHAPDSAIGFQCSGSDLRMDSKRANNRRSRIEAEANQFASDLLLPVRLLKKSINSKADADLAHILEISKEYGVSREAVARKYVKYANEPLAVVFSQDGHVRYASKPQDFPRLCVSRGSPLPELSLSSRSQHSVGHVSYWDEVEGCSWLENAQGVRVHEQTLAQRNGYRMTLLSIEDEREEAETELDVPSF